MITLLKTTCISQEIMLNYKVNSISCTCTYVTSKSMVLKVVSSKQFCFTYLHITHMLILKSYATCYTKK